MTSLTLDALRALLVRFGGVEGSPTQEAWVHRYIHYTFPRGDVWLDYMEGSGVIRIVDVRRGTRSLRHEATSLHLAIDATSVVELRVGEHYRVYRNARRDLAGWAYRTNAPVKLDAVTCAVCDEAFAGDPVAVAALHDRLIDAGVVL